MHTYHITVVTTWHALKDYLPFIVYFINTEEHYLKNLCASWSCQPNKQSVSDFSSVILFENMLFSFGHANQPFPVSGQICPT